MPIEVRDPVHGTLVFSSGETAVIDSPEFQRLRAIKQLGFADVSFPGATHTRFLHSLGVCHLAGQVFDRVFRNFSFSSEAHKQRFRQVFRLGALLHDVGHGPLSHTTEEVMPPLADLKIDIYKSRPATKQTKATHEDYTIKYLTDSELSLILKKNFSDISPVHIACLIDRSIPSPDDFFIENGVDMRPILSQLVSGELDCDRMDYLERDSYFTGTNYGKFDRDWMVNNMTPYRHDDKIFLGLSRRALYTFDDFLISRHHIHLMVYFHHKCLIYEEMLNRYLTSPNCTFKLPASLDQYTQYNDFKLHEHLTSADNSWAQRIAQKKPFKMLAEYHNTSDSNRPANVKKAMEEMGIDVIWASSKARLSKYHSSTPEDRAYQIWVIDQYDKWDKPTPIDQSTEIFKKYENARIIDRLYVAPENYAKAEKIFNREKVLVSHSKEFFMKKIIQITMFAMVAALVATEAIASSVYELSNCTQSEVASAQKQAIDIEKGVNDGYMSRLDLAGAQVYLSEVALCAGQLSKTDACKNMITNQEIVVGIKAPTTSSNVANLVLARFDESRRLIQIRNFCK